VAACLRDVCSRTSPPTRAFPVRDPERWIPSKSFGARRASEKRSRFYEILILRCFHFIWGHGLEVFAGFKRQRLDLRPPCSLNRSRAGLFIPQRIVDILNGWAQSLLSADFVVLPVASCIPCAKIRRESAVRQKLDAVADLRPCCRSEIGTSRRCRGFLYCPFQLCRLLAYLGLLSFICPGRRGTSARSHLSKWLSWLMTHGS